MIKSSHKVIKYNFFNIFKTEFLQYFKVSKFLMKLLTLLILPIGFSIFRVSSMKEHNIVQYSFIMTQAIGLLIFVKLILVLAEKPTIDKNRAAFTYYKKNNVLFSKIICELILFFVAFLTIILSIIIFVNFIKTDSSKFNYGRFDNFTASATETNPDSFSVTRSVFPEKISYMQNDFFLIIALQRFPFLALVYIFIYINVNWITSVVSSKITIFSILILMALIVIFLCFADWILIEISYALNNPESNLERKSIILGGKEALFAFIPLLNLMMFTSFGINLGGSQTLLVLVPTCYLLITLITTWRFSSLAQKNFLAA